LFGVRGSRCGSEGLHADLAELIVYREALTGGEREQVESYLRDELDLQIQ
jgi:hypothetical protein